MIYKSLISAKHHQMEIKMEDKQASITLIKRSLKLLLCSNINLFLFIFFCSLPLFCFFIFFELSLQTTVSLASQYFFPQLIDQNFTENDLLLQLVHTSLLYFFPYVLLDFLPTINIIAASSIVYNSEEVPLGFGKLVKKTVKICKKRLRGCLITSICLFLLSTSLFFGLLSVSMNYLLFTSFARMRFGDSAGVLMNAVVSLIHSGIFIVLLVKFSKWSIGWNMGMVVSVLEEGENGQGIYGIDALSLSVLYGRGYEKRDLSIMLFFFVFVFVMRLPCLYFNCSESSSGNRVLYTGLYVGLICVGNVLKWVACVVHYHDCKSRV